MAWIRSEETVGDHPKTIMLEQELNRCKYAVVGILHLLWHFTLKYAWKDGDLSKFTVAVIERSIGWDGDTGVLFSALEKVGFLKNKKVHDWEYYAKEVIYQRSYNENRRRCITAVKQLSNTCSNIVKVPLRNQTLPNSIKTKDNNKAKTKQRNVFSIPTLQQVQAYCNERANNVDPLKFINHYESNGWKVGKNPMKNWQAAVRTWERSDFSLVAGRAITTGARPVEEKRPYDEFAPGELEEYKKRKAEFLASRGDNGNH
jgi:hypothetical protein